MSLDELVPPAAAPAARHRRHQDARRGRPERAPDFLRWPAQERHPVPVRHHLVQRGPEVEASGDAGLHGHHEQDDLTAREAVSRPEKGRKGAPEDE